jgi:hypothetical protein
MNVVEFPNATGFVARPGKLMRITAVARAMLEEARNTPCDAAGCEKFKMIYERTIAELDGVIAPDLHDELIKMSVRFEDAAPSPSALRIAQAELVGWLDGLMNGIVVAVQSQFIDAQEQADAIAETVIDDRVMPGQYL